jgi:hypothetical protein
MLQLRKGTRQAIHQIARRVFRGTKFVHEEVVGFAVEAHLKG